MWNKISLQGKPLMISLTEVLGTNIKKNLETKAFKFYPHRGDHQKMLDYREKFHKHCLIYYGIIFAYHTFKIPSHTKI